MQFDILEIVPTSEYKRNKQGRLYRTGFSRFIDTISAKSKKEAAVLYKDTLSDRDNRKAVDNCITHTDGFTTQFFVVKSGTVHTLH